MRISSVLADLNHEMMGFGISERIRDGFEVAILGPPNVGKSTLLNAIAQRDVALTSQLAGTTRDVIEVRTDLSGIPVTFLDTAGLRETDDVLEREGIRRARERGEKADIRLFLQGSNQDEPENIRDGDIVIQGKADLGFGDVSGLTGEGVDLLVGRIAETLKGRTLGSSTLIRERHAQAIRIAASYLSESMTAITDAHDDELVADHLRQATRSLEILIGRVDIEDLLGDIFSRFCIGK